jgi:hypothetical protein
MMMWGIMSLQWFWFAVNHMRMGPSYLARKGTVGICWHTWVCGSAHCGTSMYWSMIVAEAGLARASPATPAVVTAIPIRDTVPRLRMHLSIMTAPFGNCLQIVGVQVSA